MSLSWYWKVIFVHAFKRYKNFLDGPSLSTTGSSTYDRVRREWVNQPEPYNSVFTDAITALELHTLDDVSKFRL